MAPVTTSEPRIRRDRAAVLASALVKELASERLKDIRRDERHNPKDPPVPMTPKLRRLAKRYAAQERAARATRKAVEALGFRVDTNADGEPVVRWPYGAHEARQREAYKLRAAREEKVMALRIAALIELVESADVKATLARYRLALSRL